MTEIFRTNFVARLAAGITANATTFTLTSVPAGLAPGTYRFRFGSNSRTSEWLAADFGSGTTFINAVRAAEGGNPALAWPVGTTVAHVLTGLGISAFVGPLVASSPQVAHEEFSPAVAATAVGLVHIPNVVLTVSRNGLIQSVAAGHYSIAGATITFSDAFIASERVVVAYSFLPDQAILGAGPVGRQWLDLPPTGPRRARDYSFAHTHQNTV